MGQAGAALGAAAGEHLAAIGGPHPFTETVLLGALTLFGLIGTEHLHTPPNICFAVGAETPHYSTAGGPGPHPAVDLSMPVKCRQQILYIMKSHVSTKIFKISYGWKFSDHGQPSCSL